MKKRNGMPNPAVHQHYVPEFYLKRFASDLDRLKVQTLTHRHVFIIEEERSIENTLTADMIYGLRETEITRLEQVLQKSGAWTIDVTGQWKPLSWEDARDVYRAVSHFSIRTPLSKTYLGHFADQGIDLSSLGNDLNDVFQNAATAYEGWDGMFHLACVRILRTKEDLLTSAFPTSSFEEVMDLDGVPYRHHVTMALDKRVLAHLMVAGFDPKEQIEQKFWIGPAEDQIVIRHNLHQIGRFLRYKDVEFLVHTASSTTPLLDRMLKALGWVKTDLSSGQKRYEQIGHANDASRLS